MRRFLLIALFLYINCQSYAQFYSKGQEPSGTKWKQLKTPLVKVVYPEGTDSVAHAFSQYLTLAQQSIPKSLWHAPTKFPAVLHVNSVLSNGFVTWAPKRMEIVSTPAVDASPEPWLQSLAIHETRHVVQLDKLNNGFFKIGSFLLGEQSVGLAAGFIPKWFLEGDAVFCETAFTRGGRGRQASFYRHYLSHFVENNGTKFSYDKWLLGSYKDYIPNHYNFGYQMVGYTNLKFNPKVWSNALQRVTRKPYTIFPFFISINRDLGFSTKKLFYKVVSHYDTLWKSIEQVDKSKEYKTLINRDLNISYLEYKYPFLASDSTIISVKNTLKRTPQLVLSNIELGKESVLHNLGYLTSRPTFSGKWILWSEFSPHPRWEYVSYSDIWVYNTEEGNARRVTNKGKFFSPVRLPDCNIAAAESDPSGYSYIAVMDSLGKTLNRVKVPSTLELKELCCGEKEELFARCASPRGMVILRYLSLSEKPDTVLGPTFSDISNIVYCDGALYFTMTDNLREDVFSCNVASGAVQKITNSIFGLGEISLYTNNMLVASQYHARGSLPVAIDLGTPGKQIILNKSVAPLFNANIPGNHDSISEPIINRYNSDFMGLKYNKFNNLFNIHSWAPIYYNPNELTNGTISIYPGFTLLSQNILSTLQTSIGYSYNVTHGAHASVEWLGWYPKISASVNYGNSFAYAIHGPLAPGGISQTTLPALSYHLGMRVPHIISAGFYMTGINIGLQFSHSNNLYWDYQRHRYQKGLYAMEPYFSFYTYQRMAHRDIKPPLGCQIYFSQKSFPIANTTLGHSLRGIGIAYLPGLFSNHSVQLKVQAEEQRANQYIPSSRISPIRGNESKPAKSVYTASFDYTFTLAYLDFPIGTLAYFKRVNVSLFADIAKLNAYKFAQVGTTLQWEKQHSLGVECTTEVLFFRSSFPFSLGYRVGYRPHDGLYFHEFMFSYNLSSLGGFSWENIMFNKR